MKNNFAYFIVSYGKAENIPTLNSLKAVKAEYPIYIVVGTDDPKLELYKEIYAENLLIFDKATYISEVDELGNYYKTHKVCTYSRLAVEDFAKQLGVRYIGYLFDDIEYFRLRYKKDNIITGTKNFNIDKIIDMYIDLLNSSNQLYIVGPPNSSFYIGINTARCEDYSTRFGNMLIYDREKKLQPYKASVLEDMSIVLFNNVVGKMSICPFGLQVSCRAPHVTKDCYGNMTQTEYHLQHSIICNGITVDLSRPTIPYKNFTPKIIEPINNVTKKQYKLF